MSLIKYLSVFSFTILMLACESTNPELQDSLIQGSKHPAGSNGGNGGSSNDKPDGNGSGSSNGGGSTNELELQLIGEWRNVSNSKETLYILENGEGYVEKLKSYDGISWSPFVWTAENGQLTRKYFTSDSEYIYDVSFDENGNMTLTSDSISKEYKLISKEGTTNVNYKKPPYTNYICIFDYYYELYEVVMRCDHATGTEANMKHLFFYGANGKLEPIGARFMYATPYYDGIDKKWGDGTYTIRSSSDYYVYGGIYCLNNSWSSRCDGKLTIKSSGNIMTLDFTLDSGDAVGHYSGVFQ